MVFRTAAAAVGRARRALTTTTPTTTSGHLLLAVVATCAVAARAQGGLGCPFSATAAAMSAESQTHRTSLQSRARSRAAQADSGATSKSSPQSSMAVGDDLSPSSRVEWFNDSFLLAGRVRKLLARHASSVSSEERATALGHIQDLISRHRATANGAVYGMIIDDLVRQSHYSLALDFFKDMRRRRIKPSLAAYTSIFKALAILCNKKYTSPKDVGVLRGRLRDATHYWTSIPLNERNIVHVNSALLICISCANAGGWEAGVGLYRAITNLHHYPSGHSHKEQFDLLSDADPSLVETDRNVIDIDSVFGLPERHSIVPDRKTMTLLLSLCSARATSESFSVAEEIIDSFSDTSAPVSLSDIDGHLATAALRCYIAAPSTNEAARGLNLASAWFELSAASIPAAKETSARVEAQPSIAFALPQPLKMTTAGLDVILSVAVAAGHSHIGLQWLDEALTRKEITMDSGIVHTALLLLLKTKQFERAFRFLSGSQCLAAISQDQKSELIVRVCRAAVSGGVGEVSLWVRRAMRAVTGNGGVSASWSEKNIWNLISVIAEGTAVDDGVVVDLEDDVIAALKLDPRVKAGDASLVAAYWMTTPGYFRSALLSRPSNDSISERDEALLAARRILILATKVGQFKLDNGEYAVSKDIVAGWRSLIQRIDSILISKADDAEGSKFHIRKHESGPIELSENSMAGSKDGKPPANIRAVHESLKMSGEEKVEPELNLSTSETLKMYGSADGYKRLRERHNNRGIPKEKKSSLRRSVLNSEVEMRKTVWKSFALKDKGWARWRKES